MISAMEFDFEAQANVQVQRHDRGRVRRKLHQHRRSNAIDLTSHAWPTIDVSSPLRPQGQEDLRPNLKSVPYPETSPYPKPQRPIRVEGQPLEPQAKTSTSQRQLEIPGWLRGSDSRNFVFGTPLSAIPDFGSSFDIIAESLALRLYLQLESSNAKRFSLPSRATKTFLGTVTLEWQFAEESEGHLRVFHVMKNCVHPIVLGRQFLKTTGTLSQNIHRVIENIIQVSNHVRRQVLFVDTPTEEATSRERILGLINGRPIGGLADTCSDLTIIKRCVAERMGFAISEGDDDKTEVEFIDGSTAFTTGTIRNVEWCFSATYAAEDMHYIDVHVMDDIPCAFILDKWLLWDNRAFTHYDYAIFDILYSRTTIDDSVCLIKELRRSKLRNLLRPSQHHSEFSFKCPYYWEYPY
jgi:hypothetical protein